MAAFGLISCNRGNWFRQILAVPFRNRAIDAFRTSFIALARVSFLAATFVFSGCTTLTCRRLHSTQPFLDFLCALRGIETMLDQ